MRSLIIAMSVACVGKGTDTGALEPGAEPGPGPGPGDPIDCVGLEGYMGYRSPIDDHIQRTQLAEFPLSVPTVAQLGGELWFAAQMFQDVENYCDVIGFAPLLELPSEEEHPLTPLQLDGVPELGQIPNQNGLVFPPADPTLIPIPERDIVVLLTTLRLADAPDMPCIGLSVANDTADPTAGFTYLDSALWCEAGMPMMDASGWYDPSTDSLRLFYSNFSMPGVSNWYADVDISGPPEDWIIADSGPSSFDDFNLLGNFSDDQLQCSGPTFYGTTTETGAPSTRAACYDPAFNAFETLPFSIDRVADVAVGTDSTEQVWLVYSQNDQ